MRIGSRKWLAHRLAWWISTGKQPDPDRLVLHHCDNPPCCNPAHLFLGTQADNMRDMIEKGRGRFEGVRGTQNVNAKLTDGAVAEILLAPRQYGVGRKLAARFGVCEATISQIRHGKKWAHIAVSTLAALVVLATPALAIQPGATGSITLRNGALDVIKVDGGDSAAGTTRAANSTQVSGRTATDCQAQTDGAAREFCRDTNGRVFVCIPSSGACDTAAEWKEFTTWVKVGGSSMGYGSIVDFSSVFDITVTSGVIGVGLSNAVTLFGSTLDRGTELPAAIAYEDEPNDFGSNLQTMKKLVLKKADSTTIFDANNTTDGVISMAAAQVTLPNGTGAAPTTTGQVYVDTNGVNANMVQASVGNGTTAVPLRQCFSHYIRIVNVPNATTHYSTWGYSSSVTSGFANQLWRNFPEPAKWTGLSCNLLNDIKNTDVVTVTMQTATPASASDGAYMTTPSYSSTALSVTRTGTTATTENTLSPDWDVVSLAANTIVVVEIAYTTTSGSNLYGHCQVFECPDSVF